jgi:hypothetical protein
VLPSSHQPSIAGLADSTDRPVACFSNITSLDIPGSRDAAVRRYSVWQQSNVDDQGLKEEYQKACNIILGDGLDLEQVSEAREADLLIRNGVKRGIAWRFVHDIPVWAKRLKQSHNAELD